MLALGVELASCASHAASSLAADVEDAAGDIYVGVIVKGPVPALAGLALFARVARGVGVEAIRTRQAALQTSPAVSTLWALDAALVPVHEMAAAAALAVGTSGVVSNGVDRLVIVIHLPNLAVVLKVHGLEASRRASRERVLARLAHLAVVAVRVVIRVHGAPEAGVGALNVSEAAVALGAREETGVQDVLVRVKEAQASEPVVVV